MWPQCDEQQQQELVAKRHRKKKGLLKKWDLPGAHNWNHVWTENSKLRLKKSVDNNGVET